VSATLLGKGMPADQKESQGHNLRVRDRHILGVLWPPMNHTLPQPEALWNTEQAAAFLGLTNARTLAAWRLRRQGPPYVLIGRCVRYSPPAVRAWLEARIVAPPAGANQVRPDSPPTF
jgi:hypothetical protein